MSAAEKQAATGALERFKTGYWSRYAGYMQECERRLSQITGRPGGTLGESCSLTLAAGGKRLRPLLVFLATRKGRAVGEEQYAAAVAVELVHMATLVHDDVLDGAQLRRGLPTLVARYGPPVSTAAGDYLFATAFEVLTAGGSPPAVSLLAKTSLGLSRGELAQMAEAGNLGLTREAYVERCILKTAGLFSTSCRLGAMFSGCSEEVTGKIGEYGRCLGLAFQIFDDILDFTGQASRIGKQVGTDLRDGTVTLPLIHALKRDDAIMGLIGGGLSDDEVVEICRLVKKAGGLDEAREEAIKYVYRANEALAATGDELDIEPLGLIADATIDREA